MILLATLFIGLSIMLAAIYMGRLVLFVPKENRIYNDRPPFMFRIIWPMIRMFVHYFSRFISRDYRINSLAMLRRAGMDYAISPEQLFGAKVVGLLIFGVFGSYVGKIIGFDVILSALLFAVIGLTYPDAWLKRLVKQRETHIFRDLPFYLDILTLSIEAGSNLTGAFTQAVDKAPPGPFRDEISRMLRDIRAGKSRVAALRNLSDRLQMVSITSLVSTIIQAERMGSSLGQVLRAQADQRRHERFTRAEKVGMEAPVKLLGPLVVCIFPTTFMVIAFLIMVELVTSGLITHPTLLWIFNNPS